MQCKQEYSNLIYEYLVMKMRFQHLKYGDCLPSIETLCREFSVADQTVKAAFQHLRTEGYISQQKGRTAKVIFQQTREAREEYTWLFFAERDEAFSDLAQSTEFITIPLLVEGVRRMDHEDFAFLSDLAKKAMPADLLRFYYHIFRKLNNFLVMNLFWETSMFQGFPCLDIQAKPEFFNEEAVREGMQSIISLGQMQKWEMLSSVLLTFQSKLLQPANQFIKHCIQLLPDKEQIPFTWRIYRDRPQICYSLVSRLLYEIYLGEYRTEHFLPSYEKMAQRYGVSVNTMRRTVKLLNQLGAACSVNGKGTRIFTFEEHGIKADFSCPAIRRNIAYYFQSYEIMLLCCEGVVRTTLAALSKEEKILLSEQLKDHLSTGNCDLTPWSILSCVAVSNPLKAVREVFSKIIGLFLWGHPLRGAEEFHDFDLAVSQLTEKIIQCLELNDVDQCAAVFKAFFEQEFPLAEQFLKNLGMKPGELRLSPGFHLLLL